MAPWLPHQGSTKVVETVLSETAALQHGGPFDDRGAIDNHSKRLPFGVGIDGHNTPPIAAAPNPAALSGPSG